MADTKVLLGEALDDEPPGRLGDRLEHVRAARNAHAPLTRINGG